MIRLLIVALLLCAVPGMSKTYMAESTDPYYRDYPQWLETYRCQTCRQDWYKGRDTLLLAENGVVKDTIANVDVYPAHLGFPYHALPSHRGEGDSETGPHGKHRCVLYFIGKAVDE